MRALTDWKLFACLNFREIVTLGDFAKPSNREFLIFCRKKGLRNHKLLNSRICPPHKIRENKNREYYPIDSN